MDHLVLFAPQISPYLEHPFVDGSTALDHLSRRVEILRSILSPTVSVHVLCDASPQRDLFPAGWNVIPVNGDSANEQLTSAAALHTLDSALPDEESSVILTALDAPFFDVALARYLHTLHRQAWCDYTFGDGFPTGYSVEILRRRVIGSLAQLAEVTGNMWTRSFVFDALSSDINAFDIETEAAGDDLALLRLSLTVDVRGNFALCNRLVERGVTDQPDASRNPDPAEERYDLSANPLTEALKNDLTLRRTLPFYYQIQITNELPQRPSYLPWDDSQLDVKAPGEGTFMALADWERLLEQIAATTPEAVLSIGYRGEPGLHPDLPQLLTAIERYPGLQVYLETSGVGWADAALSHLASPAVKAVIVEVDSVDPERYQQLRGDGFSEVIEFISRLSELIPGRVYAQATRMKETEWELQTFFRHWDEVDGVAPLIQKYNSWAGRLPDRRVMDLAPLHRIPCWHLQRDMVIWLNGDVPRCFQDLSGDGCRGNIFTDGLEAVWERGTQEFVDHGRGTMAPICEKCDEYYTFNA
jgi:spiro-SPASM protein